MKKIVLLTLALMMVLCLVACGGADENTIKVGTSEFSIVLPEGYKDIKDDYGENQIAYYYKDDDSIDLDVYQWTKEDKYTLESEAQYYEELFGAEPEIVYVNGIRCYKYISEEEYEGETYMLHSYLFENETDFFGICFWTCGTSAESSAVEKIINTLKKPSE